MLTSITPLGERNRNRSWGPTVTAYIAASILGGLVAGGAAGGLGAMVPAPFRSADAAIVAALLGLVAIDEVGWLRITPLGRRQVNEDWLDEFRGWVVGVGFGFQLGLGMATIVTSLAVPATFALAFFTHSVRWGMVVGATFGLARALPILRTRVVTSPARLAQLHRAHDVSARWARLGVAALSLFMAGLAVIG